MTNSNQSLLNQQQQQQQQEWLDAWMQHSRYCHYFSVTFADDNGYPMGNWNAPFFSIEEAKAFKDLVHVKHPKREFMLIEGVLHVDVTDRVAKNTYWETWIQKHKQRIHALCGKEA